MTPRDFPLVFNRVPPAHPCTTYLWPLSRPAIPWLQQWGHIHHHPVSPFHIKKHLQKIIPIRFLSAIENRVHLDYTEPHTYLISKNLQTQFRHIHIRDTVQTYPHQGFLTFRHTSDISTSGIPPSQVATPDNSPTSPSSPSDTITSRTSPTHANIQDNSPITGTISNSGRYTGQFSYSTFYNSFRHTHVRDSSNSVCYTGQLSYSTFFNSFNSFRHIHVRDSSNLGRYTGQFSYSTFFQLLQTHTRQGLIQLKPLYTGHISYSTFFNSFRHIHVRDPSISDCYTGHQSFGEYIISSPTSTILFGGLMTGQGVHIRNLRRGRVAHP